MTREDLFGLKSTRCPVNSNICRSTAKANLATIHPPCHPRARLALSREHRLRLDPSHAGESRIVIKGSSRLSRAWLSGNSYNSRYTNPQDWHEAAAL